MQKLIILLCLLFLNLGSMLGCSEDSKTAMIDINVIINNGPHAQAAAEHIKKSQDIYQHNLNVIEKILSQYQNKEQAKAYLTEATRQLQKQLDNSKLFTKQALLTVLDTVLATQKYDLVVKKDCLVYVREGEGDAASKFAALPEDITVKVQALYKNMVVTFPPLPRVVDTPNLPADLGEGVPFPPKAQ